jgi:hypothetical protein
MVKLKKKLFLFVILLFILFFTIRLIYSYSINFSNYISEKKILKYLSKEYKDDNFKDIVLLNNVVDANSRKI